MPDFIHVSKANDTSSDEWRYTLGPVYMPGQTDAHGDSIEAENLEKAIHDYVRSGDRTIRLQHQPDTKAGEWVGLLTWPYPVEMPVEYNGEVQKRTYPAGTPFMGVVWEPEVWDAVKKGEIRGYSLGGFAEFESQGTPVGPPTEKAADVAPPTVPTDIAAVDPALTGEGKRRRKRKPRLSFAAKAVQWLIKFQDTEPRDEAGQWTSGPGGRGMTRTSYGKNPALRGRDTYIRQDSKYVYAQRHHLDLQVGDEADVSDGENEFHKITKIEHPERDLTVAHFGPGKDDNFDTWSAYPTIVRTPRKDVVIGKSVLTFKPKQPVRLTVPTTPVLKFNPSQARDQNGRWTGGGFSGGYTPHDPHSMGESVGLGDPQDMKVLKDAKGNVVIGANGKPVEPYSAAHMVGDDFSPERKALHEKIINEHLNNVSRPKGQPTQYMNGGGPGSGKSAIRKHPDTKYPASREVNDMTGEMPAHGADAVLIDPDAIKMMLPETKAARGRGETDWAAKSHEESSYLGKRIHQAAVDRGLNVIYDGTGDSGVNGVKKKVKIARDRGYRVEANYVYLHPDEGVRRAAERGARTGRFVPETTIRHTYGDIPPTFDGVKEGVFDHVRLLDNNQGNFQPAKLIGESGPDGAFNVIDQGAYTRFLNHP